jgi:uncharacterized protein (DUF1501 family)
MPTRTTAQLDPDGQEHRGVSRRSFLALAGAGGAAIGVSALGNQYAFATPARPDQGDVLVVVFNRGGMDGLNVVAPFQMPSYRALRPTLRVKAPDEFPDPTNLAGLPLQSGGNVAPFDLDGVFALHPGMELLHRGAWASGHLAIVHAAGMPAAESTSRSHFESERNFEAGSADLAVTDGFLNRYLGGVPDLDRLCAVGRGSTLQRMLVGGAPAFSMGSISGFGVRGFSDNARARTALMALYPGGADLLTGTGAETLSITNLIAALPADPGAQNGAAYGWDGLAKNLKEVARLIKADVGLRVAVVDDGGWDTHNDQGVPEDPNGYLRGRTRQFSEALQAFYQDLGGAMSEVTLVTMSEFGRTINENGSGGTDHGRATSMFVLGHNVRGGVHGQFPDQIVDAPEGDLTVLNDYRHVLAEVLAARGGATDLGSVFPGYTGHTPLGLVA